MKPAGADRVRELNKDMGEDSPALTKGESGPPVVLPRPVCSRGGGGGE